MEKLPPITQQSTLHRLKEVNKELRTIDEEIKNTEQRITWLRGSVEGLEIISFIAFSQLRVISDLLEQPEEAGNYDSARERLRGKLVKKTSAETAEYIKTNAREDPLFVFSKEAREQILESYNGSVQLERRLSRAEEIIRQIHSLASLKLLARELEREVSLGSIICGSANREEGELGQHLVTLRERCSQLTQEKTVLSSSPKDIWEAAAMGKVDFIRNKIERLGFFETKYKCVNQRNHKGQTPLHLAASFGQLEVVELLLENKADWKLKDHKEKTPWDVAARRGHRKVAYKILGTIELTESENKLLLQYFKELIVRVSEAEREEFKKKKESEAKLFQQECRFEEWLEVYVYTLKCFELSCWPEGVDYCKTQIKEGINPWREDLVIADPRLVVKGYHAVSSKKDEIISAAKSIITFMIKRELLSEDELYIGANLQMFLELVLFSLEEKLPNQLSELQIVVLASFISNEIQRDEGFFIDLIFFESSDKDRYLKILRFLSPRVQRGVENWLRSKRPSGAGLLHLAAERGDVVLAEGLIERKLDLEEQYQGQTSLHVAVLHAKHEIVDLLLKKGANINAPYVNRYESYYAQMPPLSLSIARGCRFVIPMLLKHKKVDVNALDASNRSPLFLAFADFQNLGLVLEIINHPGWQRALDPRIDSLFEIFRRLLIKKHKNQIFEYCAVGLLIFQKIDGSDQSPASIFCFKQIKQILDSWRDDIDLEPESGIRFKMRGGYSANSPEANPSFFLRGYHTIFPHHKESIENIAKQVCSFLKNSDILRDEPVAEANFKLFLQLALFFNSHIEQLIMRNDTAAFSKIKMIRLANCIFLKIEREPIFFRNLNSFTIGNSQEFWQIINFLTPRVQEGVDGWLGQLNDLQSSPSPKKVDQTAPSLLPVSSIHKDPPPAQPKPLPFPVTALEEVLKFSREAKFIEMLKESAKGQKGNPRLLSWLSPWLPDLKSLPIDASLLLATNVTFKQLFSFVHLGFSKLSFSNLKNLVRAAVNGEDVKKPNSSMQGGWAPLLESIAALQQYMQSYRISEEALLDTQLLIISLLRDEQFFKFLSTADTIEQLANLCAAFEIPDMDHEASKMIIEALIELHRLVMALPDKEKISSWNDLFFQLANQPGAIHTLLGKSGLPLLEKLKNLIGNYSKTQITPIELLALASIRRLLIGGDAKSYDDQAFFPNDMAFVNRKELFDSFKGNDLGPLMIDPVTKQVRSRRLDGYCFTDESTSMSKDPNVLECSLEGSAFEEFSFMTQFQNFTFRKAYFQRCDFSRAKFWGRIRFSEIFLDAATAKTFLPALWECVLRKQCIIGGKITLIRVKSEGNQIVKIPPGLKDCVDIRLASWAKWDDAEEAILQYEELIPQSSETLPREEKKTTETQGGRAGYLNSWLGGMGRVLGYGAAQTREYAAGSVSGIRDYWMGNNSASVRDDYSKEIEGLKGNQKELEEKLAQLEAKRANDQSVQRLTEDLLEDSQEELRVQIEDMRLHVDQLKKKQAEKAKIQTEQLRLINGEGESIKVFYETLLTDLSSILQTIFLLQNPIGLIDPVTGKATQLSNKQQQKSGVIIEIAETYPDWIQKIVKGLQFAINLKDPAIELLGRAVKPFAGAIPYVGEAVKAGIGIAEKANDQAKFAITREALRGKTTKALEKIAESVCRKIAFAYLEQIKLLTTEGAMQFAQGGVLRIVAALFNGEIKDFAKFPEEALFKIRKLKIHQNRTFLGIEIPFTQQPLSFIDKREKVTAEQLFRECGVAYKDQNGKAHHYSNDLTGDPLKAPFPSGSITQAGPFGYMWVSEAEWDAYFGNGFLLAVDEQRQVPTLASLNLAPQPSLPAPRQTSFKLEQENQARIALLERRIRELEQAKEQKDSQPST